jgi:hypothetical protein
MSSFSGAFVKITDELEIYFDFIFLQKIAKPASIYHHIQFVCRQDDNHEAHVLGRVIIFISLDFTFGSARKIVAPTLDCGMLKNFFFKLALVYTRP